MITGLHSRSSYTDKRRYDNAVRACYQAYHVRKKHDMECEQWDRQKPPFPFKSKEEFLDAYLPDFYENRMKPLKFDPFAQ